MKFLKKLYFYFLFPRRLYPYYNTLDVLLIYLENVGIRNVSYEQENFYCNIIFNDGTKYHFWNRNKECSWMHIGKIIFSNGKELEWRERMPSYEVLYKYDKFIKSEQNKDEDISQYLPIKLQRKLKLNKLK